MRQKLLLLAVIGTLFFACKSRTSSMQNTTTDTSSTGRRMDNFTYLYLCMQGEYSSEEQSKNDSDYYNISLRMVPIWKKENDEFYLYVEQAMSTALDKPYRQRVYKVVKTDDTHFESHIYTINNQAKYIGKRADDTIWNTITPDSLTLKDGCAVHLTFDAATSTFNGATSDKTCPSERSGAAYATAKVKLNDTRMESWDQGWNNEGKQVWGATKGGYVFLKKL
jgi:CpeT/CpcT family (DUF1001)